MIALDEDGGPFLINTAKRKSVERLSFLFHLSLVMANLPEEKLNQIFNFQT